MSPNVAISEATAKELLAQWLRGRAIRTMGHRSWNRVTFTKRHYWAGIVYVLWDDYSRGYYGFHVYDNGEIASVGRIASPA